MKVNGKAAIFVCLGVACCLTACESAEPRSQSNHASRETRHSVDLGGGVSLSEIVRKSADGEVTARSARIARDGERVFERFWSRPFNPNDRPTVLRSYFCNGKLVLSEQIGGMKDVLPMLVVHDDAGAPVQAFDKKSDGMLVP